MAVQNVSVVVSGNGVAAASVAPTASVVDTSNEIAWRIVFMRSSKALNLSLECWHHAFADHLQSFHRLVEQTDRQLGQATVSKYFIAFDFPVDVSQVTG